MTATREEMLDILEGTVDLKITATPYVWRDPSTIPPRDFLYGDHIVRRYVSGIISMGGVGKTSEVQVEIAAMVTGRDLLGVKPKRSYRVWYINLEDPLDEIDRRFAAIFKHYGITREDIGNRLFMDSGRNKNFIIARMGKNGLEFDKDVLADIEATICANKIDYLVADPFVNLARFPENDNNAMAALIEALAGIGERQNCAVGLPHHVRKGASGGHNGGHTVEDARGAGALVNSCRNVRVLNIMTKEEGEKADVERHRSYFRIDNGKANLAPPPEDSEWRKIVSVDLDNAMGDCPADLVGVVTLWEWPDPLAQLTVADLCAAQKAVSQGGPWRKDVQAKNWVGKPIAQALGLDIKSKADVTKVKGALKIWTGNGMFKEVEGKDDKRNARTFIEVGIRANDGETVVRWSSRKSKAKSRTAGVSAFITLGQKQQLRERGFSEQNILKMTPEEAHRILGLKDRFQKVGRAPDGVECVQCQKMDERTVFKIKDNWVPAGQPGGKAECLHEDCAENWFTGRFPA
jgi:hypothetical protein